MQYKLQYTKSQPYCGLVVIAACTFASSLYPASDFRKKKENLKDVGVSETNATFHTLYLIQKAGRVRVK